VRHHDSGHGERKVRRNEEDESLSGAKLETSRRMIGAGAVEGDPGLKESCTFRDRRVVEDLEGS
jgi:hypothetical protein